MQGFKLVSLSLFMAAAVLISLESCIYSTTQPKPEDSFPSNIISTSLQKTMTLQEQIIEYVEQTDTGSMRRKTFDSLATPMQKAVDSMYKQLTEKEQNDFIDYKTQLTSNLADRKANRTKKTSP